MARPLYFDQGNNAVFETIKVQTCSGQPLEVTTISGDYTYVKPATTAGDSFGRLRVSEPFTLFDSSHRYTDNGKWSTSGATATFNSGEGLVDLTLDTVSGSKVYRETTRVFPYQPGKSLQVMNSFVMNSGKANLRQRVGYFSSGNGYYVEVSGTATPFFVQRSSNTGSVVNTRVAQADWNIDKLDGTGPSAYTLDITKSQLSWFDFEWLGVGTVRAGFLIDGELVHCHSFHHANNLTSTYMTTATLPCRYEIENLGATATNSTLKQICSTVLSEGGYDLRGKGRSVSQEINAPYDLTNSGVLYPTAAIRLKSSMPDAVVVLNGISVLGITNNANYRWELINGATTVSGGTWVSAGADSPVEVNTTATGISGGQSLVHGFVAGSNQGSTTTDLSTVDLFKYQLQRDSFTGTSNVLALVVSSQSAGADVLTALNWEEINY